MNSSFTPSEASVSLRDTQGATCWLSHSAAHKNEAILAWTTLLNCQGTSNKLYIPMFKMVAQGQGLEINEGNQTASLLVDAVLCVYYGPTERLLSSLRRNRNDSYLTCLCQRSDTGMQYREVKSIRIALPLEDARQFASPFASLSAPAVRYKATGAGAARLQLLLGSIRTNDFDALIASKLNRGYEQCDNDPYSPLRGAITSDPKWLETAAILTDACATNPRSFTAWNISDYSPLFPDALMLTAMNALILGEVSGDLRNNLSRANTTYPVTHKDELVAAKREAARKKAIADAPPALSHKAETLIEL